MNISLFTQGLFTTVLLFGVVFPEFRTGSVTDSEAFMAFVISYGFYNTINILSRIFIPKKED